jgi:N-acetylmuramoyl-L-alanine amidase
MSGLRRKIFHRSFARVSPVFFSSILFLCAVSFARTNDSSNDSSATGSSRREAAATQFQRAEEQRDALNQEPLQQRTLTEYKEAVSSYRRVYLITPHAAQVPDALMATGELYTEMGDRFGGNYYHMAVESYEFLAREYPTSKHSQDAMLRAGHIAKEQLNDLNLASQAYSDFLHAFPQSTHKREAQEALDEIALLRSTEKPSVNSSSSTTAKRAKPKTAKPENEKTEESIESASNEADAPPPPSPSAAPRLRRISTELSGDSTTVTIDLENTVPFVSGRVVNPDRIFFDLRDARLTPEVARQQVAVEGDQLNAVRVAQHHAGIVRVVLEVNDVKDYDAHFENDPPRLVIELYGKAHKTISAHANRPSRSHAHSNEANSTVIAQAADGDAPPMKPVVVKRPAASDSGLVDNSASAKTAPNNGSRKSTSASKSLAANSSSKPDLVQPLNPALPTRDGASTLTRTLGLKINRIVIDAGHGGHDTGTIGPTGLMEKDLCLDVALRLGKIIRQRLPGAEVVYTRSDDSFIPLEDRTRIANESKADLFVSIHANSSQNHTARGIETYYLNLKGTPEAMEVAARENAASQGSVHDLEDLVKKITRTEKVDESREFAEDIQDALSKRAQKNSTYIKDRGVRKAPFVVLIGADMPSILTEISFLSNPTDEQLLKKPDQRQRVAEGLYQGVASYLQSLNSLGPAPAAPKPSARSTSSTSSTVASVEDSRNPR